MDETERKQITDVNEDHVREWFEASDFVGTKLDKDSGKKGKKADWRFTKQDLTILCEVKTIFSGGQSGVTEDQYERHLCEDKRKFERFRARTIAEGSIFLTDQHMQDYLQGKIPYQKQSLIKEDAFRDFLSDLQNQLETDQTINRLPFTVIIFMNTMYVAYKKDDRQQFVEWLKGFVLWAQEHHNSEHITSTNHYTFRSRRKLENGKVEHSIEALVTVNGPFSEARLRVNYIYGGVPYNELKIAENIEEAVIQLRASSSDAGTSSVLSVIALWSESDYLKFPSLLMMDVDGMKLGDIPQRYYLIDWAFEKYTDLAGIVLFWFHYDGDFWHPKPDDKVFPVGLVITNPYLPNAEQVLKAAGIKNCSFVTGIASDPLTDKD